MAAKTLSVSLVLGGLLGSGWVSSIGQAKKDISLLDRMTAQLDSAKKGLVIIDADAEDKALQKSIAAHDRLHKAKADTQSGGNTKDLKEQVEFAKEAVAAADKGLDVLERRMKDQRKAAFMAGVSVEEYAKKALLAKNASASWANVTARFENFRGSLGKTTTLLRNSFMQVAGVSAAVFATVSTAASTGDALKRTSDRLGFTIKGLQEYHYAARQAGMTSEDFEASAGKLTLTLGKAVRGDAGAAQAFQRVGLNAKTLLAMPVERQLEEIADRMSHMSSESERAAFAQSVFGDSGITMVEMLKSGKAGLQAMRAEAGKKGAFMFNDADAGKSRKFVTVLGDMKQMFVGIKNAIGIGIMDTLREAMEKISASFLKNRDNIVNGLRNIMSGLARLLPPLIAFATGIMSLVGIVLKFPGAAYALVGAFLAIGGAIAAVRITALAKDTLVLGREIARAIPNLLRYVATTKAAALAELAWGKARSAGAALGALGGRGGRGISGLASGAVDLVSGAGRGAGRGIAGGAARAGSGILPMLRGILPRVLGLAGLIGGAFIKVGLLIKGVCVAIGGAIAAIGWPVALIVAAIIGAGLLIWKYWDPIKKFFIGLGNDIRESIGPSIQSITDSFASIWETVSPTLSAISGADSSG